MFNIEKFGLKIAQLRKRADMTQFELAERLNLTRQAISKYERGESFPDVTILVELADVLGVTAGELISAGEGTAGETQLLEQIAAGQIPQSGAASQDILGVAPLLRPSTVEKLTANLAKDGINLRYLTEFASYLSDEGTLRLLEQTDCSSMTPDVLEHLLPFMDFDSKCRILDKILAGKANWHLLKPLRVDRSLIEAAVIEGVLPWEALK